MVYGLEFGIMNVDFNDDMKMCLDMVYLVLKMDIGLGNGYGL